MNEFIPLPKSQSNNRVIHEYQSTNRRFTFNYYHRHAGRNTLSHDNWNNNTKTVAETRTPRTKLERRANPYSSQSSSSSYSGSEPTKNLLVHLVLATHRPPYDAIAWWNWMQKGDKEKNLFGCGFLCE
jgi:hypothetical protein